MSSTKSSTPFRVGQRIRTTSSAPTFAVAPCDADGTPQEHEGTSSVKANNCYADVLVAGSGTVDVILYVPRDGKLERFLARYCSTDRFESVRGKPMLPGIDDRRRGSSEAATAAPRSAKTASDPDVDALLGSLRDALTAKTGSIDEDAVRSLVDGMLDPLRNGITDAVEAADAIDERLSSRCNALGSNISDLRGRLEAVSHALHTATQATRARVRVALAAGSDPSPIVEALGKFYTPGEEAPANVLLCSPPSLGKSYGVRTFAAAYDAYLEHGCSDDMDEIATLLGSPMPDGKGGFITVDGVLTQAVRTASQGKNVLLLLDEVLRLAPRAQEWLLSFLTGVKRPDGTRCYRLRTRRVDADGALEVLECDAARLHLVGATNLGMLQPVEAFWSRWETVRLDFTPATVQAVAAAILAAHGIPDSGDVLAKAWAQIVTESRSAVAEGKLRFPVDMRMLERAAQFAETPSVAAVGKWAADRLADNTAHWNADLGDTDPQSVAVCDGWTSMLRSL